MKPWIPLALSCLLSSSLCAVARDVLPQREPRAANTAVSPIPASAAPRTVWTAQYSCKASSLNWAYEGHVKVRYERVGSWVSATAYEYKIWTSGSAGYNRANLDMDFVVRDANNANEKSFGMSKSPDAMIQDNQWRTISQTLSGDAGYTARYFNAGVMFTFDSPVSDPKCWAERVEDFGT